MAVAAPVGLAPKITDEELSASFLAGEVAMYVSSVMKLNSIRSPANFPLESPRAPPSPARKSSALRRRGDHVLLRRPGQEDAVLEIPGVRDPGRAMATFTPTATVRTSVVPVAEGQQPAYDQIPYAVQ